MLARVFSCRRLRQNRRIEQIEVIKAADERPPRSSAVRRGQPLRCRNLKCVDAVFIYAGNRKNEKSSLIAKAKIQAFGGGK